MNQLVVPKVMSVQFLIYLFVCLIVESVFIVGVGVGVVL